MAIRLKDSVQNYLLEAARHHFPTYTEINLRRVVILSTRFLNSILEHTKFVPENENTYVEAFLWPHIPCGEFNNKYLFVANRQVNNYGVILKFLYAKDFLIYTEMRSKLGIVKKYRINLSLVEGIKCTNEDLPYPTKNIDPKITDQTQGVYRITNMDTGRVYIGSTTNARKRVKEHIVAITLNSHHNHYFQEEFDSLESLSFTLIEDVSDPNHLTYREQVWINHYRNQGICYNISNACSPERMKNFSF